MTPQETPERLRAGAARTSSPPGGFDSRLVEEIVHGEDIRRPVGLVRHYPHDAVVRALQHQARTSASFGGAKEMTAGLRLVATGADASIGHGPEVRGAALSLLLALTRRRVALDDLEGPGVQTLVAAL